MKYDVIELANVIRRQYRCHRSLRSHSARGLTDERVLGEANFVARASSRAALKLSSLCGVRPSYCANNAQQIFVEYTRRRKIFFVG